jgi:hypothetical protein
VPASIARPRAARLRARAAAPSPMVVAARWTAGRARTEPAAASSPPTSALLSRTCACPRRPPRPAPASSAGRRETAAAARSIAGLAPMGRGAGSSFRSSAQWPGRALPTAVRRASPAAPRSAPSAGSSVTAAAACSTAAAARAVSCAAWTLLSGVEASPPANRSSPRWLAPASAAWCPTAAERKSTLASSIARRPFRVRAGRRAAAGAPRTSVARAEPCAELSSEMPPAPARSAGPPATAVAAATPVAAAARARPAAPEPVRSRCAAYRWRRPRPAQARRAAWSATVAAVASRAAPARRGKPAA